MIGHRATRYRFPWRDGNRFRLLIDGDQFYPAMLHAINTARDYVVLEFYLVASGAVGDRFIAALTAACGRGVRVYALLDAFGAANLNKVDRRRLSEAGVTLAFYNPLRYAWGWHRWRANLFRNHRKLLLVDGAVAYVGGAGITDDFDPTPGTRAWRETLVEIHGPVIADWQTLFVETWQRETGAACPLPAVQALPLPSGQRGRLTVASRHDGREIRRSLLNHLRGAEQRAWVATAYFLPSWKIRRALRAAARRGVDVCLLLPGPHTDHPAIRHAGRRFYYRLLRQGVRIFEYQPRFTHAKVLLVDDWAAVGSSNVDRWNLQWNLEANQEVWDATFAAQVQEMFVADFTLAQECDLHTWRGRPGYRRGVEWFWGWADRLLKRLTGE